MKKELKHYGTPQRFAGDPKGSGRYRKGSGDDPYQHTASVPIDIRFSELKKAGMTDAEVIKAMGLNTLESSTVLRKSGKTEKQIADILGVSTTELRAKKSIEKEQQIARETSQCIRLRDKGTSVTEISRITGLPERTVYDRLDPNNAYRTNKTANLAKILKEQVANKTYLDVSSGVELQLGVSKQQLGTAVSMLEQQGYTKHLLKVEQAANPGKYTSVLVLTKDDIPLKKVYNNRDKIMSPDGVYSNDKGNTWSNIQPPISISSNRIKVRYGDEGGKLKDGVIELRRGVEDISLGQAQYAQVRIAVDGTHYLKGMAVYNDNMPKGVDIIFNTNKPSGTPIMLSDKNAEQVFKHMKSDPDNPFGSTVRQLTRETGKIGADGKPIEKVYSACNIVNDEGDWGKWSRNLSSQFLSKQYPELAKRQLDLVYRAKKQEYEEICALTNPAVKKALLLSFSDQIDSDSVSLKAAAMPRQQTQVILPVTSLKDNEVYAPNFRHGEEVILVRYPHGGIFEIPRLKVNKNNPEAKKLLGNNDVAIGINANVAQRLSGADFDGDTVVVIPIKNQKLKISGALKELNGFDPQERYKAYPGMPKTCEENGFRKQMEMGKVSNLITDMTLKGATDSEIARAVKHSMVVIDAEKHNLNYKQSYDDNGIAQLKVKYQGGANKGASTLISKASSEYDIPMRKEWLATEYSDKLGQGIDPKTGRKIFKDANLPKRVKTIDPITGKISYSPKVKKDGQVDYRTEKTTKMDYAFDSGKDAYSLISSSNTRMERIYADHANKLRALGNEARKEYISTPSQKYNPSAKKTYSEEVKSLYSKLKISQLNAPRERQAQLLADSIFQAKKKDNPDMDKEDIKKLKTQTLNEARNRVGAVSRKERNIDITDKEWEAIQAGAISNSKLMQILANTDEKAIKERATPKKKPGMSQAQINRARSLLRMGYTQAEVADALGVSVSTINKAAKE